MIELPEARTIAKDLRKEILGKMIVAVNGNFTDHKFTFYYEDPNEYHKFLNNKKITKVNDRNFYIEIEIEDYILLFRDGANIRYYNNLQDYPEKSKLRIEFNDGSFINVTTSMYSFICVFNKKKGMDNLYYQLELNGIGVLDDAFTLDHFKTLVSTNPKHSLKALLATEQRILGIGNGVCHDIFFNARMHPKRKVLSLTKEDVNTLYNATKKTITQMTEERGRDTEKDIYGKNGLYRTILSSKTYKESCPVCKGPIKKENYLGGSIYYCPNCQQ